jgi:PAS domain S-box-containing protein
VLRPDLYDAYVTNNDFDRGQMDKTRKGEAEMQQIGIDKALAERAHEQEVLYHFTDRLYRARTLRDSYDAALDAIGDGLGCPFASILRFDSQGVMRFVAWRGLSPSYRRAVEGHSPWRPGDQNAEPIWIGDLEAADEPETLKITIRKEGIRALAFIPLTIDGVVIGKFMTYYEAPHHFTDHELRLSLMVARQLSFSIRRHLADDDARRLIAIVESSDDAIFAEDLDGILTNWNAGAERLFGYAKDEAFGKSSGILIPSDRGNEEPTILGRIRNGERIHPYETVRQRKDGSLVDISLTVSPIMDKTSTIVGVSKIARDITDRRRAEEKQQLLLREMNHRIRNLFAVTSSIVGLSAQSAVSATALAATVRDRFDALARAHALTVSANGADNQPATTLHAIIQTILAPYDADNGAGPRFAISGPDDPVSGNAVIPLSLLIYELATNAAKYGGLSTPGGRIDVRSAIEGDRVVLTWCESGTTAARELRGNEGFGSKLISATTAQLAADLSDEWGSTGKTIRITVPRNSLAD